MKNSKKLLALLLALVMLVGILAGCGETAEPETAVTEAVEEETVEVAEEHVKSDTLVVGYSNFSEKFSPFFAESAYDQDVASLVSIGLLGSDRDGAIIYNGIEGEYVTYNGTEYFYDGIADCEVVENEDGTVDYNFTLREDIVFSDGVPLTADDVIFSMYVLCDPTYDGSSTLYAQPIIGMEEYRAGMDSLMNIILADGADGYVENDIYTAEQYDAFWTALDVAGASFAQEIVDYCAAYGYAESSEDVYNGAAAWGFDVPEDATAADFWAVIVEAYGGDVAEANSVESAGTSLFDFLADELGDGYAAYTAGVQTGESAANIAGIEKTGDYSLSVHMSEFDATAIYQLSLVIAPMHYYGDADLYDYENNQFGFVKGDLSLVRNVTTTPLGAGPYKFVSYENGVVSFEANENYWKGEPLTKYVRFQEMSDADKLTGIATGTIDISDPSISDSVVAGIQGYNSNGELCGDVIETNLVDNLGYGYLGICAENVLVGGEKDSDASKNLRKAFATLFSVYRDTVIYSYYGERAAVIQYPISNTSWAAPKPADEGYAIAFSTDVDGNSIYTDDMTDEEKYEAALQAAIGFFKAAGYTWDEETGTFTAAPEGASLTYELQIPGDGVGDHPVYGVVTNAAAVLATIGIELQINDLSDSSALWDGLDAGTVDMWAAAWGATVDPDMYQIYHSSNTTNSNHYRIADEELDELIMAARTSADTSYRKATYKQCLDIILDWACEIPMYQRKNCVIFSAERVNLDTVTPDITTFWGWMNDIELLEMN